MFIELVDTLRCLAPHEESWLVLSSSRMQERHVLEGALGCPVCRAEYRISAGEVHMGGQCAPSVTDAPAAGPDSGVRLAAQLALTDALGFAVLCGGWALHADALHVTTGVPLLLVNPPGHLSPQRQHSVIRTAGTLPLAAASARAVALDGGVDPASAVRAARTGARLAGPVTLPLPQGVRELARDDSVWVGERETAPSALVTLHVRRGDPRGAPAPADRTRPANG